MRQVAVVIRRAVRLMMLIATGVAITAGPLGAQDRPPSEALDAARRAIARGELPGFTQRDLALYRPWLLRLYADSTARLLWTRGGYATAQAHAVVAELGAADARGLRVDDYDGVPLTRWADSLGSVPAANDVALLEADARLSLSLMRYLDHIHRGRVDPRTLGFALPVKRAQVDFASVVRLISGAPDVHAVVGAMEPPYAGFAALERVLARYRALAADTSLHAPAATRKAIRPGDAWSDASTLRTLLVALGDLPANAAAPPDSFVGDLVDGVRHFQRYHGLEPDGVIGPATMAQLRVPLARRVTQIELTLERWRWLPDALPARYAVVNIPGFRLYGVDRAIAAHGSAVKMDVIVGRAYGRRRTPVFVGTMRYVIFHPYWDVPPSIARNEEVPRIRRDRGYAERLGLEIVRGGDTDAVVYATTSDNLWRVVAGSLRLRQRPGPQNALGAVKFIFPNEYNVYLHGTPAVSLFEQARRDFSHGCIRVADPAALAEFVLSGEGDWTRARIDSAMQSGGETTMHRVVLARPLPVFILYATVVPDETGVPYFYPDLYGHDGALEREAGTGKGEVAGTRDGGRGTASPAGRAPAPPGDPSHHTLRR